MFCLCLIIDKSSIIYKFSLYNKNKTVIRDIRIEKENSGIKFKFNFFTESER